MPSILWYFDPCIFYSHLPAENFTANLFGLNQIFYKSYLNWDQNGPVNFYRFDARSYRDQACLRSNSDQIFYWVKFSTFKFFLWSNWIWFIKSLTENRNVFYLMNLLAFSFRWLCTPPPPPLLNKFTSFLPSSFADCLSVVLHISLCVFILVSFFSPFSLVF